MTGFSKIQYLFNLVYVLSLIRLSSKPARLVGKSEGVVLGICLTVRASTILGQGLGWLVPRYVPVLPRKLDQNIVLKLLIALEVSRKYSKTKIYTGKVKFSFVLD